MPFTMSVGILVDADHNAKTPYPFPSHIFNYALAFPFPAGLPLFLPCACAPAAACPSPLSSAAFMVSSSCFSIVSSASLRRVKSMTSSVFMTLRPPCLEKISRSRAVFARVKVSTVGAAVGADVGCGGMTKVGGCRAYQSVYIPAQSMRR